MASGNTANGTSDEQLMLAAAAGSAAAFEQIVERYHGKVLGLLHLMLGERERARDLTQECFLRLLKSAGRYKVKARFSTYLFTIARRLAFDESRRSRPLHVSVPEDLAAPTGNPHDGLHQEEVRVRLRGLVASLPREERDVLMLSELGGLRYAEIAELIGCPEGTVASRKNRALRTLRRKWQGVRA